MAKMNKKSALIAASVAGLLALSGVSATTTAYAQDVHCAGVNACKGMGDCGGAGHACAGKNACKGTGWVKAPAELCTKIGGTVAA
jgi:hypothetical protein